MKYTRYESEFDGNGECANATDYIKQTKGKEINSFDTPESIVSWYILKGNRKVKFLSLDFLIGFINEKKPKKILSLGAGPCIMEYLLKMCIPEDYKVTATDFNSYQIKRAKKLFPLINPKVFDFTKDDVKKLGDNFDLVVFFNSSFTMNDSEFIHLVDMIKKLGVKYIIDFSGCIPLNRMPRIFLEQTWCKLKYIFISYKQPESKIRGYIRSKGERKRLYRKAGLRIIEDVPIKLHDYAIFVMEV